jgi:uncharacterized protein YecT (DUF1311 family)
MKHPFLRLSLFVCMAAGVVAQTSKPAEQNAERCENAFTTAAMRTCEASRYATAQQELDAAYQNLMSHINREQKVELRKAQDAWIRFRDASADFQASLLEGGTSAPLVRIGSLTDMTRARALELKKEAPP